MTIINSINRMNEQAENLTNEMAAIFAKYPSLEAPEFMPELDRQKWDVLFAQRRVIYDYLNRIDSICGSFRQFEIAELS